MDLKTTLEQAIRCHREGRFGAAKDLYVEILNLDPNHPDALHLLGLIAHQTGKDDLAADLIARAIRIDPDQAAFHCNLGNVLASLGDLEGAILSYKNAVNLNPHLVEANYNLGNALYRDGKVDEAVSFLRKTVMLKPDLTEAQNNLGIALHKSGRLDEALECFQEALRQKPDSPHIYLNSGDLLKDQDKPEQAIERYKKALALKPDFAEAYFHLGNLFHLLDRWDEAVTCYEKALRINPEYMDAYANLGKTLKAQGRLEDALSCYNSAIRMEPDSADLIFDRSTVLLLEGDLLEGFKGYERRFDRHNWEKTYPHRFSIPRWDGSFFPGKTLFVHCEQGFGDNLQFVRYLPMVKGKGGKVVLETSKALVRLFGDLQCIDELVEGPSRGEIPGYDFHIPLMSLPGIFGTTLETIPAQIPYLQADQQKARFWQKKMGGEGLRAGLVWQGKDTDPKRACSPKHLAPLFRVPGVRWYGLQKGGTGKAEEEIPIVNLGDEFKDFSDTAGAMENLDLIVSIDTSVAHLAGAMGKPVWALLMFSPDWRWLMNREDSPWYPTMRLFRQPQPGDWTAVIGRVVEELRHQLHEGQRLSALKPVCQPL
ncbi:MAG: tetratricopeptide repeat-containing glycosyltransferase family protein [Deltaproteobacteria bacterium]|nr:tetratricopeptide repeat-containing glycosyltransferase family protein [Deltaproteobacteria bacterium]